MQTIERSATVAAPATAVWAVLQDLRVLPEVSPSTVEVRGVLRVEHAGQRFQQVVTVGGRRFESDWTVEALEPGRSVTTTGSLLPGTWYRIEQTVTPLSDDRCRLDMRLDYRMPFGPVGRLAAKLGAERRAADEAQQVMDGIVARAEGRQES